MKSFAESAYQNDKEFEGTTEKETLYYDLINGTDAPMTYDELIQQIKDNPGFTNPNDVAAEDSEGNEYTGAELLKMAGVENEFKQELEDNEKTEVYPMESTKKFVKESGDNTISMGISIDVSDESNTHVDYGKYERIILNILRNNPDVLSLGDQGHDSIGSLIGNIIIKKDSKLAKTIQYEKEHGAEPFSTGKGNVQSILGKFTYSVDVSIDFFETPWDENYQQNESVNVNLSSKYSFKKFVKESGDIESTDADSDKVDKALSSFAPTDYAYLDTVFMLLLLGLQNDIKNRLVNFKSELKDVLVQWFKKRNLIGKYQLLSDANDFLSKNKTTFDELKAKIVEKYK